MRVRLHAEARAELREARRWYYERSPLSATAFAHAIDNAVSRIVEAPTQYPLAEHRTHKLVLQRFPFNIFYLPGSSEIVIVAAPIRNGAQATGSAVSLRPSGFA